MKSLRFILKIMGNYGSLVLALIFMLGEGLSQIFGAVSLGNLADAITGDHRSDIPQSILMVLVPSATLFFCIFFKDSLMGFYLENGVKNLRWEIVRRVTGADYIWLKNQSVGELLSRSMGDTEKVAEAVRPILVMGVSLMGILSIIVIYMLLQNWMLALIFLILIPAFMVIQWALSGLIKKYHKGYLSTQADLAAVTAESASMHETIKSLNAEAWMLQRFNLAAEEQLKMERGEIRIQTILAPVNTLCRYLPQIVLIVIGGLLVQKGAITLGTLLSFTVLSGTVSMIMGNLAQFVTHIRRMEVVIHRISEWWNIPQEPLLIEGAVHKHKLQRGIESVAFSNLSYAYNGRDLILDRVEGAIKRGDQIAITGESGSGKSTLLTLLATLGTPVSGQLCFNGMELCEENIAALRNEIAYVEQQPYFFAGSIRENLVCGNEHDEQALIRCLKQADAWAFVEAMPQALETQLDEHGLNLSGGQRQRLAIARALLKNASMLLMDEAMSAMDQQSELRVLDQLLSLPERPILIFVTHKTNIADRFSRHWHVANGMLEERCI